MIDQPDYNEALIDALEDAYSNKLYDLRDDTEKLENMFSDGGGNIDLLKEKFQGRG